MKHFPGWNISKFAFVVALMCMCADGMCTFTDVRQCVEAEVGIRQYLSPPCLETGELGADQLARLTSIQCAPGRDPPISASVLETQAHTVFNMSTGNPTQDLMLAQQVHYSLSLFPGPHSQSLFSFESFSIYSPGCPQDSQRSRHAPPCPASFSLKAHTNTKIQELTTIIAPSTKPINFKTPKPLSPRLTHIQKQTSRQEYCFCLHTH